MSNEWVWIVGGGILQVPIIKEAKKRGYSVMVTDKDLSAPGMLIADNAVQLSTYDLRGHMELAETVRNEKIKAVLTAGADVGPTVSMVADALDLPAEKVDVAKLAKDKGRMRYTLNKAGIKGPIGTTIRFDEPTPHYAWMRYTDKFHEHPYPCVVKPVDSSGSRGITLVKTRWQLPEALRTAKKYSQRPKVQCLIEKYVEGPEVSLDFFVKDQYITLANAAWRKFGDFGIEIGFLNPWKPPRDVLAVCREVRKALGVTWGPLKIDLMCTRKGWYVMETATRLSGGFDHTHAAAMLGKDITGAMLDVALGIDLDKSKLKGKPGYVYVISPEIEPGPIMDVKVPRGTKVLYFAPEAVNLKHCANRAIWIAAKAKDPFRAYRKALKAVRSMTIVRERE